MNMARVVFQHKQGNEWVETWATEGERVYEDLAKDLIAKKLENCTYIRSIKRKQNYDGTNTITVNYTPDCGGGRRIYTIER